MAKKTPNINSSSTADIAFLLLCYFLMTTTMGDKTGIQRTLPKIPESTQQKDIQINRRNLIQVKINSSDNVLLIAGEYATVPVPRKGDKIDDALITAKIKEWMANRGHSEQLPAREMPDKPEEAKYPYEVFKGVVSLQNDRSTHYDTYITVQNAIVRAFNELRDEEAFARYGRHYEDLTQDEIDVINFIVPKTISEAEPKDKNKTK